MTKLWRRLRILWRRWFVPVPPEGTDSGSSCPDDND